MQDLVFSVPSSLLLSRQSILKDSGLSKGVKGVFGAVANDEVTIRPSL
jgi:hypothetical protein